jgi:hypothetical protein
MWELLEDDLRNLQHAVYFLTLEHDKEMYEEIMESNYEARHDKATHKHSTSQKKTKTKKVEKNGK